MFLISGGVISVTVSKQLCVSGWGGGGVVVIQAGMRSWDGLNTQTSSVCTNVVEINDLPLEFIPLVGEP